MLIYYMFKNIILLIVILINILIINFTQKLEYIGCKCSKVWYRIFIKYYSILTIFMSVLIFCNIKSSLWKFIHNIYYIIGLFNIYILFKYSEDLYKKKCDCIKSWEHIFIYYYSMTLILFYGILIVGILFASLFNNRLV
jgi:hypothetical protein